MARTVKDLVEHLKEHRDAIIIVGPGALSDSDKPQYSIEEFNENYNRRTLVREPNKMWDFFNKRMYKQYSKETENVYQELSKLSSVVKLVVDQNMNTPMIKDKVELHGSVYKYVCTKCKTMYTANFVQELGDRYCELCESPVRPTALLSGERYDKVRFTEIEQAFKNTHTVILVGMDYTEESLMKLIAEYGDIKDFTNNESDKDKKMLVSIQSLEEAFDPNELAFFEFIVKDNAYKALERLTGEF